MKGKLLMLIICVAITLFGCKNEKKENTLFWYSSTHNAVLDIENDIWKFYYRGNPNSTIFKQILRDKNKLIFVCADKFSRSHYDKDSIPFYQKMNKDGTFRLQINNNIEYNFLPYKNDIEWDSIRIETVRNDKVRHQSTLVNNNIDFKNKNILAWMISDKPFKLTKVDRDIGHIPIYLKLFYKGEEIAEKQTSMLFFSMKFNQKLITQPYKTL